MDRHCLCTEKAQFDIKAHLTQAVNTDVALKLSELLNKHLDFENKCFFNRNLACSAPHPLHITSLLHHPLNLQCLWGHHKYRKKSLNCFWQSLGLGSSEASSADLHTAGRIYYTEKIRRRHSVTRLLSEREESWVHRGLRAGRWPLKMKAG